MDKKVLNKIDWNCENCMHKKVCAHADGIHCNDWWGIVPYSEGHLFNFKDGFYNVYRGDNKILECQTYEGSSWGGRSATLTNDVEWCVSANPIYDLVKELEEKYG